MTRLCSTKPTTTSPCSRGTRTAMTRSTTASRVSLSVIFSTPPPGGEKLNLQRKKSSTNVQQPIRRGQLLRPNRRLQRAGGRRNLHGGRQVLLPASREPVRH